MQGTILLVALSISAVFTIWPIAGKLTDASGFWVGILVTTGTFIGISFSGVMAGAKIHEDFPTSRIAILSLVAAGMLNGIGMYSYPEYLKQPDVDTATFVTVVITGIIILSVITTAIIATTMPTAGFTLPSTKALLGIAVMCVGIYIAMH